MVCWAVRNGWRGSLLLGAALALALGGGRAAAAKAPLCAGGVFQVDVAAGPLVPGGGVPDLLTVGDGGAVSIASGCAEIAGKLRATRRGTKLAAKWSARTTLCTGLPKKASLRARFDAACETLTGKFRTKGRKVPFTAVRAGIVLDGLVPASIRGEALHVGRATGAELLAADAGWADAFAALGASADAVEIAHSAALPGSALDLRAAAWTAPGAGWAQRLADLAAGIAAHPAAGYVAEEVALGGHPAWKVTVPSDPAYSATWYVVEGETLLVFVSGDEALLGDVLAELPPPAAAALAARAPRGAPLPMPGESVLALLLLSPIRPPVCVAEPFGRNALVLIALDAGYGVPVPAFFTVNSALLGETNPIVSFGGSGILYYRAARYGSQEQLTLQAFTLVGGQGIHLLFFPVQHCLNGLWQDGDRLVTVTQLADHLSAELTSGTICGEEGGFDFTGDMVDPEHFAGSDLKVCNPEECVEAGLLEASVLVDYTASISFDGSSAEVAWESTQFDLVYDDDGNLVSCPPNGEIQPRTFTLERLSFGPGLP
jgi:hypothetical protein